MGNYYGKLLCVRNFMYVYGKLLCYILDILGAHHLTFATGFIFTIKCVTTKHVLQTSII